MEKWYEGIGAEQDVIVGSRIRLRRNIQGKMFPEKLPTDQRKKLGTELMNHVSGILSAGGVENHSLHLSEMDAVQKSALLERSVLTKTSLRETEDIALTVSEDESYSVLYNCDDHLRLQVSESGLHLREAFAKADRLDDAINETYNYAFDDKYGYMTAFPTNVGTGMRAYLVLHLPLLASSQRFRTITSELGRYGVAIRDAFVYEDKNPSGLYVIYNQKTLGQSESEIMSVLTKVGMQLAGSERRVRNIRAQRFSLQNDDEVYRSYGILKYARYMRYDEALLNLSRIRIAASAGKVNFAKPLSLYKLMLMVSPDNLRVHYQKELDENELNVLRAEYLRSALPEILG